MPKLRIKKYFLTILKFVTTVVLFITFVETGIRLYMYVKNPAEYYYQEYNMMLFKRIDAFWNGPAPENILLPPYKVFTNYKSDSSERLNFIYQHNRTAKSQKIESFDFLRNPKYRESTKFTATFNNFGFRSQVDFKKEKPKNTKRIFLYGSYHAFGFGVEDNQTYGFLTETQLNQRSSKIKYEVWNSAQPAGTAIVGLAQFKRDLEEYQPDIIVLDYGFVDGLIKNDLVFLGAARSFTSFKSVLNSLYLWLENLKKDSFVVCRIFAQMISLSYENDKYQYEKVLNEYLSMAKSRKLPVYFVKQNQSYIFGPEIYIDLIKKNSHGEFINVSTLFSEKSHLPTEAQESESYWLKEIDSEKLQHLASNPHFQFPQFFLDYWQINKHGHQIIADELTKRIR